MNHRHLDSSTTADLAANVATLLGGTELSAIDPSVRAALLAALGNRTAP